MKVLNVNQIDAKIDSLLSEIQSSQAQISEIQKSVQNIVELESAFTGKMGESIRSFYEHVHQPFLILLHESLTEYSNVLQEVNASVHAFEGNKNGFVHEGFLEEELPKGLDRVEELTYDLVSNANHELKQIEDILPLPNIDTTEFSETVDEGRERIDDVIKELHEMDESQTKELARVEDTQALLEKYVGEMSRTFSSEASIQTFSSPSAFQMPSYGEVWKEVYEGKAGEVVARDVVLQRLAPKQKMKIGFTLGVRDLVWDLATGIHAIATDPIGTLKELGYMVLHPLETGTLIKDAIYESFQRDVINGDDISRARWFTYALGSVAVEVVGAKGTGSATKMSGAASNFSKLEKLDTRINRIDFSRFRDPFPEGNLVPVGGYNAFDSNTLLDQMYMKVERGPGTGRNLENKGMREVNSKIRIVNGKKEYNVNGKWLTDKQFSVLRQKAVRQAWRAEKELVEKTGRGSRDWTPDELEELLTTGKVKGYEGQHMKSANEYPNFAGDPDNIQFLKGRTMDKNEHLDAHEGNYKNPTNGYYDPNTGVKVYFGDNVPWN